MGWEDGRMRWERMRWEEGKMRWEDRVGGGWEVEVGGWEDEVGR